MSDPSARRLPSPGWPLALGLLLCLAVYAPRLGAPLVWDDYPLIVINPAMERPAPLGAFFSRDFFDSFRHQSWRPLGSLVHHRLVRIAGKRPAVLRGLNLLLHLANALLLASLLKRAGAGAGPSLWACALFLVHPAHVETVMCASFIQFLLGATGVLAMLLAHQRGRWAWSAAGYGAAVLSVETGMLGLPLAVLYDFFHGGAERVRRSRTAYGLYGCVLAAYVWMRFIRLKGPAWAGGMTGTLPFFERAYYGLCGWVAAFRVLAFPASLRIEYFAVPPASRLEGLLWILGACALAAGYAWALRRQWLRQRASAFYLLWPLPCLAVTSNLVPLQAMTLRFMAERWLYLPYLGLMAAMAPAWARRPRWGAALLIFWGGLGLLRARDWSDETRLWGSLLKVYPWSAKAQEGLGEALFRGGRHPEALESFRKALALREDRQDRVLARYMPLSDGDVIRWESPSLHRWLGLSYLKTGDLGSAERHMLEAVRLEPRGELPYRAMAWHLAKAGGFGKARAWAERGLALHPGDPFLLRVRADAARGRLSFEAGFY